MNRIALTTSAILMLATTACLDVTRGTGDMGRVSYSLYTDYDPGNGEIGETPILVMHEQTIHLSLTDSGERRVSDYTSIEHSISPSSGVTLDYHSDDEYIEDIDITVEQAGTYTLTTEADGAVLDTITLAFDAPTSLDAVTWVRAPGDEEFVEAFDAQPAVDEGSQITFVAIPLNADGDRIAGQFDVTVSADPAGAVVDAYDTWESHEDHVHGELTEASVYFIEAGEITLTVSDLANGVDYDQTFDVAAW